MTKPVPERLLWGVEQLAPEPTDSVLEVGCGNGVAAELILQRLEQGRLTAIDRSPAAIGKAGQRNELGVAAGRACFKNVALAEAIFEPGEFDRVFAVNVNVFWLNPVAELKVLVKILKPGGTLCLVYQVPSVGKDEWIVETCRQYLLANGFSEVETRFTKLGSGPGVCILARNGA